MSTFAILKLPRELQEEILSYISRPTDLKALCLVSKETSAISTPRLYRDLNLRSDSKDPKKLSFCLTRLSHSSSLEHVQTIKIGYSNVSGLKCPDHCSALGQLLPKLYDNSLTRFEFDDSTCPTHEQLKYLWQHQKRLCNLQLDFKTYSPTISDLVDLTDSLRSLKSISELDLDLGSGAVDSVVCPLLEILDLSHLQKLRLASAPDSSRRPPVIHPVPLGFLSSDYFPMRLTHLTLRFVSSIDNNLQLDNYPSLTHLALHCCDGSQDLFAGYSRPTLKFLSLVVLSTREPSDRGLADMLHRFRGLESLAICISLPVTDLMTVQFLVDAIDRHKDTLKYLFFRHDWHEVKHAVFDAELYDAIKKCKNLSRLGLSLYKSKMAVVCKGLLEELPALVTLIVLFQSSNAGWKKESSPELGTKIANRVMRDLSASSKFSVFAFGRMFPFPMNQPQFPRQISHWQCIARRRNPQESSTQPGSGDAEEVATRIEVGVAEGSVSECDLVGFSYELPCPNI